MKWKKLKHIFAPDNNYEWMISHAANPFAKKLNGNVYRIFFTCRDAENKSYISFADVDFNNNFNVARIADKPVLSPGRPGLFDDSGVAMGCLIVIDDKEYLYYLGWNLKVTVPWQNSIGLAVYNNQTNEFEKFSMAPVIDRSNEDPFSISYPCIVPDNSIYKMWYGSNLNWGKNQSDMQHVIKYAESKNGINWNRINRIDIKLEHENEYALSKPFVIIEKDIYKMWYSYRANGATETYRIGYAESPDGIKWHRKDSEAGIDISESGWDSEMIEYPCIVDHNSERYMLYNGNGYGKTGFGIAISEQTK